MEFLIDEMIKIQRRLVIIKTTPGNGDCNKKFTAIK